MVQKHENVRKILIRPSIRNAIQKCSWIIPSFSGDPIQELRSPLLYRHGEKTCLVYHGTEPGCRSIRKISHLGRLYSSILQRGCALDGKEWTKALFRLVSRRVDDSEWGGQKAKQWKSHFDFSQIIYRLMLFPLVNCYHPPSNVLMKQAEPSLPGSLVRCHLSCD